MNGIKLVLALAIFASGGFRLVEVIGGASFFQPVELRNQDGFLIDGEPSRVSNSNPQKRLFGEVKIGEVKKSSAKVQRVEPPQENQNTEFKAKPQETSLSQEANEPELDDPQKVYYSVNCDARNKEGLMPNVVWKRLVEKSGKTTFTLQVESDLANVSNEVFGGEGCWPKLWSLNPKLENPHRLPAGTIIQFKK